MVGMCPEGRCSLGEDCFCPACKLCGEQLHKVAQICADVHEDDAVMCKVKFGCDVQKQRARETPAAESPRRSSPRKQRARETPAAECPRRSSPRLTSSLPASPGRRSPRKHAPSGVTPQAPKKRHVPADGKKRGPKGGRQVVSKMTLQN
jgi:hypothetical protein